MTRVESALRGAISDLNALERAFPLVGGFAVSARVEPRTTRDAALFAIADDAEVARARDALGLVTERGYARGKNLDHELDRALAELGLP